MSTGDFELIPKSKKFNMVEFACLQCMCCLRERFKKNKGEKYGLLPNRGRGSPRVIKNQTPFLEKYFFSELVESF